MKKPLQYSTGIVRNSAPKGTGLIKGAENYIGSEIYFLSKRKTSYVGSCRLRNVAVARSKPVNKTDPNATIPIPAVQFKKGPSPDCGHSNRIKLLRNWSDRTDGKVGDPYLYSIPVLRASE